MVAKKVIRRTNGIPKIIEFVLRKSKISGSKRQVFQWWFEAITLNIWIIFRLLFERNRKIFLCVPIYIVYYTICKCLIKSIRFSENWIQCSITSRNSTDWQIISSRNIWGSLPILEPADFFWLHNENNEKWYHQGEIFESFMPSTKTRNISRIYDLIAIKLAVIEFELYATLEFKTCFYLNGSAFLQ